MSTRTQAEREFDWTTGRDLERKDAKIDGLERALVEIEHHSTDANAAATARAALAVHGKGADSK